VIFVESTTSHSHHDRTWARPTPRSVSRSLPLPRPELVALLALAAVLNLWALSQNAWANEYYSAAVHSMSGSWHNFLFGSFDSAGLMTVDKPPLALWVQALSVKAFGFNSLAILVPQALMGVASVGLLYDLTRRRFGRQAGFVAGLVLALTPIAVAVSRHNNPDALLVLCCVGAMWCFVRALEDGATKWLVFAGVCIGLGFETKMGVALMVVPGMAAAWLWIAPRGRMVALRQLALAGLALVVVAMAWPLMVELTPASSRPWIAGTSDNSVFSLILEYNGLGRLDGQAGGPQAFGGGGPFGGATGWGRLLNESLGGQAGWLLGLALVGALGIAFLSRLRRDDPRSGWIIAIGGAFAVIAVAFSFAGGIFHPYYVSLLAPFVAALAGATFAQARSGEVRGRVLGALAIGAGAVTELIVIGTVDDLGWLIAPIVLVAGACAFALVSEIPDRWRAVALACGFGVLLIGPAIWSVQTLGHPTSGTFPAGGPESQGIGGGGFGAPGGMPQGGRGLGMEGPGSESGSNPEFPGPGTLGGSGELGATGAPPSLGLAGAGGPPGALGVEGSSGIEGFPGAEGAPGAEGKGTLEGQGSLGAEGSAGSRAQQGEGTRAGPGAAGASGIPGGQSLAGVLTYTEAHGGGTIAVASQSEAAPSIVESGAEVAGIGGFSGKETTVSTAWLREAVDDGRITWILTGGGMVGPGGGQGGDTREGSESAIDAVTATCSEVPTSAYETAETETETGKEASAGREPGATGQALFKCGTQN
jgi:4-amino-4-deoxy-L-arabinose transferase-like glycosyltransferase